VDGLRDKYKELKVTTGTVRSYLGMVMDFSNSPYVSINQVGMIEDIIRKASESPDGKPKYRFKFPTQTQVTDLRLDPGSSYNPVQADDRQVRRQRLLT
jgi:hypothetical protein